MEEHIIQMDAAVAKDYYIQYIESVKENRKKRAAERQAKAHRIHKELYQVRVEKKEIEQEDEKLKEAYRELSKSNLVINIHTAISRSGLDDKKRLPKLAICRADARRCHMNVTRREGTNCLQFGPSSSFYHQKAGTVVDVRINGDMFTALNSWEWRRKNNLPSPGGVSAHVPIVPPEHRPAELKDYYIMWEAVWDLTAPVDPFLLRKVNDDFYVVVAQWDLTELERTVLEARPT
jgi:hypothetical protein